MTFARKLGLSLVAGILGFGLVGVTAPSAHALDSGWGCGACKGK